MSKIKGKDKLVIIEKLSGNIYNQLKEEPYYGRNIKKLKNYSPETWRYRLGNYRLFYEIDENEKIVSLTHISTRESAY